MTGSMIMLLHRRRSVSVDSATASAADVNLDASLRARRSSSVAMAPSSADPAFGSKSTTADWTSQVTSKLPELCPQWQALALEFLEVGVTQDFAAWASLCNRVGVALLAPKTLALERDATTPVEVEGHRDGEGNADEPPAAAQGADETQDEPNHDDEGDKKGANGDIANGAGVITPELETQSLVAGTVEGDHNSLNSSHTLDTLSLPLPKTDRQLRYDRELEEAIKHARRRQHATALGVRFSGVGEPVVGLGKVGRNITWQLERPCLSVFNRGPVHAKDGDVLDAGVTSGIRTKDRQVDFLFVFKMGETTWTVELSYDDVKEAWEHMHTCSVRLGGYGLPWGQPSPFQMAQYLEDVLNSAPAWHAYSQFLVELCGLRTPYDMSPALQVHFPKFPAPHCGKIRRTVAVPASKTAEYPATWSMARDRQSRKKQALAEAVKDNFRFDKATEAQVRKKVRVSMQGGQLSVSRGEAPKQVSVGLQWVTYYGFKVTYGPPSKRKTITLSVRFSYVRNLYKEYKSWVHGMQSERPGFFSRVTEYRNRHDKEVLEQRFALMQGWLQVMLNNPQGLSWWDREVLGLQRMEEDGVKEGMKELMEAEVARVERAYEAQRKEEDEELTRPWFARGVFASMWEDEKEEEEEWWRVMKVVGA